MRFSLDPIGILLGQTLPALLLFVLYGSIHALIEPVLDAEAQQLWTTYAWLFGAATLAATGYAVYAWVRKVPVHFIYGILAFAAFVPLLWSFMDQGHVLFPREISFWMVDDDAKLYSVRLLSITLLHALFVLVGASLRENRKQHSGRDLAIGLAIPLMAYLGSQLFRSYNSRWDAEYHVWTAMMILMVMAFLFFVFRGMVSVLRRKQQGNEVGLVVRVLVGLVFPLGGLFANKGFFGFEGNGLFGDLSHWGFYAAAILNGLVVVWGESPEPRTRMLQFILRAIGFSYVLYFFVLFVPFLPLSILAIIAFGLGFLLLAPVLLFLVQGLQLVHDVRFLSRQRSLPALLGILLLSVLVLPGIITGVFLSQRAALHTAMDQVFGTAPEEDPTTVNTSALQNVLATVRGNKERNGWAKSHAPFITPWFNKVVMDNLMLSEAKLRTLDRIYFGEDADTLQTPVWRNRREEQAVALDSLSARPQYDESQQAWRTWVDLQMTNPNQFQSEYRATFNLPAGAWISDQYLMIEGEEVKGVLAERKAATWIYQQIRSARRDPSLTRYIAPGVIELRVFPLEGGQTRHGGFEVLHKEPLALTIGAHTVQIGDSTAPAMSDAITSPDGSVAYIPASVKQRLPIVQRRPQFHIVADASLASLDRRPIILSTIEDFIRTYQVDPGSVTLHITDAYTQSLPWSEAAKQAYLGHQAQGGFFSDRPIRHVLTEACRQPTKERPVIVIAPSWYNTSEKSLGIWLDDLGDLSPCLPEAPTFYLLQDGKLTARNFNAPLVALMDDRSPTAPIGSYAWPDAQHPSTYLPVTNEATVALLETGPDNSEPLKTRDWMDALRLEGRWRNLAIHPEKATAGWLALVRNSFEAQVLTPATAWICLENGAQLNTLMKKQKDVLNANVSFDASEVEPTPMSEPELWWLLVPMLLFLAWRRSR